MKRFRVVLFIPFALLLVFGLFWLMQALIAFGEAKVDTGKRSHLIDFVRVKREAGFETKKRELPQKRATANQPKAPDVNLDSKSADGPGGAVSVSVPQVAAPTADTGRSLKIASGPLMSAAASDTDTMPMVRVDPQYPQAALQRNTSGYALVMFTIAPDGSVRDAQIIESEPPGIFDNAALQAVRKWKYKPKIENGEPVERPGVKVKLSFRPPT